MPTTGTSSSGKNASLLLTISTLRTGVDYRAAELTRRRLGAGAMVGKGATSQEHASVRLLIGVWDTIAASVRDEDDAVLEMLFKNIPVCHMFEALREAVEMLRKELGDEYAVDFEWLYRKYLEWLKARGKDEAYRTRACGGIQALFG